MPCIVLVPVNDTHLRKQEHKDVKQMPAGWERVCDMGLDIQSILWQGQCAVAAEGGFSTVQCCCKSLLWLFQWGKGCEYPSPVAPFYGPWHTSPWMKTGENVVGSVLLFNIPQFPNVSYHQNELVEDTAHSGSCSAYFWKRFPSCFIPLIVVQLWYLKSWRDICKMVSS